MGEKNILYVVNHMDWFWSHRLPLALGAQEAGYKVSVACTGAEQDKKLASFGFRGFALPDTSGRPAPLAVCSVILALRKILKSQKPDALHAITIKYAFFAGLASLGLGLPKIAHTIAGLGYLFSGEGIKPRLLRAFTGPLLRCALKRENIHLIFQNPDDMAAMIRRGFAARERAHLIRGSGVDTHAFKYVPEPENDAPLVLMPTRLVHDKGVGVFIEAARLLKNKGASAKFAVAGGVTAHNPRAIAAEEMREMTRDGAVEWLGKVEDMPALLAQCALVVYPSYYGEGIPKVLLEAAATGRAIVTTDHPGCREAVAHGENGLLVPVKDPHATADAMEKLLGDPELRRKMAAKSRTRAETEFNVERIVRETLEVYG